MKGLRSIYLSVGIHMAPEGTLLHYVDRNIRAFGRMLGVRRLPMSVKSKIKNDSYAIAIWISGGIGDHLIAARYVRDLMAEIGDVPFDVFTPKPQVASWIFSEFSSFRQCYEECYACPPTFELYPFTVRLTSFIDTRQNVKKQSAAFKSISDRMQKLLGSIKLYNHKIDLLIKYHPRLDGYLGEVAVLCGFTRMTIQQGVSGIKYGGDKLQIAGNAAALAKFGLGAGQYMTIHNGHDTEFRINSETLDTASTKTYPHFAALVTLLRQSLPSLKIVQVGARTSTDIDGIDLNLIEKTTLPECAEILRHSALHIDGESGLVHMAACLGVRSCVVFGPTPVDFFAYPQNINIRPNFCGNCWWMTEDWLAKCPRGFEQPRCLSEQKPETIVAEIIKALQDQTAA